MADEGSFQTGICSSNWWCTSRSPYTVGSSSPCSTSLTTEMGSFAWSSSSTPADALNMPRASYDGRGSSESDSAVDGNVLMDSQLAQSMTRLIGLSSPTIDWSHGLTSRSGERGESNFQAMLQGEDQDHTDHNQKSWNQSCGFSRVEDNTLNMAFKPAMSQAFAFDQQRIISSNSGDCTVTTQSIPSNSYHSMTSTSYGYPSTLIQGLYEPNSLTTRQTSFDNQAAPMSYSSSPNYNHINSNEFQQSWPPKVRHFLQSQTPPGKQQPTNQLHLSNTSSSFWNPSASTAAAMASDKTSLYSSPQPQFLSPVCEEKPSSSNLAATTKRNAEEVRDLSSSMTKKASSSTGEGSFKKPRVETPSPLPTFKVRKEKLGDRITALQQLVSPFGKTDTASVLFEAIEYIKFLHEQVSVLSTPYVKNSTGAPMQQQQISVEVSKKEGGGEGGKQDLRSRGLCLIPISSTFSVTNETTADFWTPTFGGTFR